MSEGESTTGTPAASPSPEDGQGDSAGSSVESTNVPDKGQGEAAPPSPEDGQGNEKAPGDGQQDGSAKANDQTPKHDGDTLKWLSSKGYSADHFDPGNESHTGLINQMRTMEAEHTKAQQEKNTQEVIDRAKMEQTSQETDEGEPEGPLKKYDAEYGNKIQMAYELYGVDNPQALFEAAPEVYNKLEASYDKGRQRAWEEEQDWKREQREKADQQKKYESDLRKDFETARDASEANLRKAQEKYPNLQQNFAKYGVNKLTTALSNNFKVFPEMLFVNPDITNFLAEASEAIAYRHAEPERHDKWKQDYEKEMLEARTANGPRPSGTSSAGGGDKKSKSGSSGLANLTKNSKKLVTV